MRMLSRACINDTNNEGELLLMVNKRFSGLALLLGASLGLWTTGCGGNNVTNPSGALLGNPFAINQQTINQSRIVSVIPSGTQITSLVTNVTDGANLTTVAGGGTPLLLGAESLVGVPAFIGVPGNQQVVYAINPNSVQEIFADSSTGALSLPNAAVTLVNAPAANVAAADNNNLYIGEANAIDVVPLNADGTVNAAGETSVAIGFTPTSLSADGFLEAATSGAITQLFTAGTTLAASGTGADLSGVGDLVTTIADNVNNGNGTGQSFTEVFSAGSAGPANPGIIGVGFGIPNQTGAGTGFFSTGSGFITIPAAQAGSVTVVPTAEAVVNTQTGVNGSTSTQSFLVVGTNVGVIITIPINQVDGSLNLVSATETATPDGLGVIGLAPAFQGVAAGGFNSQNGLTVVTGAGPTTPEDAFGYTVNALGNLTLDFSEVQGQFNAVPLGNEAASANGNPVVFTSFVP